MNDLSALQDVMKRIETACFLAGRLTSDVTLVAVSKNQTDEKIRHGLDAGLRIFGENRVQEAVQHWERRRSLYSDLELHLIGPLQTNKVKEAVALFDVIQTVDRPSLIDALIKECKKQNKFPKFFVQLNIGNEPQKSGVSTGELAGLLEYAHDYGLEVSGLMCIPPVDQDPEPYFIKLKELASVHHLVDLSMGMSSDFDCAILQGATYIRVGTALFGAR